MKNSDNLISITGLWEQTDKNGDTYYTGSFAQVSVYAFPNHKKKGPNDPDFVLYFGKRERKEDYGNNAGFKP